jgi:hypothetical protein
MGFDACVPICSKYQADNGGKICILTSVVILQETGRLNHDVG